jgi:hypothetical protein
MFREIRLEHLREEARDLEAQEHALEAKLA